MHRAFNSHVEDCRKRADSRLDEDSGTRIDILAGRSPTPYWLLAEPAPIRFALGHASYRLSISRCDSS